MAQEILGIMRQAHDGLAAMMSVAVVVGFVGGLIFLGAWYLTRRA